MEGHAVGTGMTQYRDPTGFRFGQGVRHWIAIVRMAGGTQSGVAPRRIMPGNGPLSKAYRYMGAGTWHVGKFDDYGRDIEAGTSAAQRFRGSKPVWRHSIRENFADAGRAVRKHGVAGRQSGFPGRYEKSGRKPAWQGWKRPDWHGGIPSFRVKFQATARSAGMERDFDPSIRAIAPKRQRWTKYNAGIDDTSSGKRMEWESGVGFSETLPRMKKGKNQSRVWTMHEDRTDSHGSAEIPASSYHVLTRWLGDMFSDEARRPPSGVTGFDGRMAPIFPGRKPAF